MRNIIVFIAMILCVGIPVSAQDKMSSLTINVSNIGEGKGNVHISIYRPEDKWLSRKAKKTFKQLQIDRETFTAEGTATLTIEIPQGKYALSVYYDENGNGKLNTKFLIPIPKEPTGFSNGYKPGGMPKYRKAEFTLGAEPHTENVELTD